MGAISPDCHKMECNTLLQLDSGGANTTTTTTAINAIATPQYSLQPDYSLPKLQEALQHFASIDPIQLCNEAKVELCRATIDLRSCRFDVQSVLNSCGHASLCEQCSRQCDVCPVCGSLIPKIGKRSSLRLFHECVEAGLLAETYRHRWCREIDREEQAPATVERLYSFFDVALDNNLLSLISHYITDVCMDGSAVSSDPVIAFLMDAVVVKDWCVRTFENIIAGVACIYNPDVEQSKEKSSVLLKFTARLSGLSTVLEELESSWSSKESLSEQRHDIHYLHDSILQTKQHIEMMIWYKRHQFLEGLCRHESFSSWNSDFSERRTIAEQRSDSWLLPVITSTSYEAVLFIDDALLNLEPQEYRLNSERGFCYLQQHRTRAWSRVSLWGLIRSYPFENLRSAIDVLFLYGTSDMLVAKQSVFLYYLFDRLWKIPDGKWRSCVDDFSVTFNISRHLILESFIFYLLDDQSDEALQEACRLLPEISGPATHPKVAKILLERQNPFAAHKVLRYRGTEMVSLNEAVTAIRVRVECGFLIEAFMYQRSVCTKVKGKQRRHGFDEDGLDWVEVLVSELCHLCIRRNLLDRFFGLPWNVDEEKALHKCLLDYAPTEPLRNAGSLFVVSYLQRCRYAEAYHADRKLKSCEDDLISKNLISGPAKDRMLASQRWRAGLVDKSIQLLPEVEQQKIKTLNMTQVFPLENDNIAQENPDLPDSSNLDPPHAFQLGGEPPATETSIKFHHVTTPLKEFNRASSKKKHIEKNDPVNQIPRSENVVANLEDSTNSIINWFFKLNVCGKPPESSRLGRDTTHTKGLIEMSSWSNKDEKLHVQTKLNGGLTEIR